MIKAILFDVYGTLLSTGSGSIEACRKILQTAKPEQDPEEFYAEWKILHKRHMASTSSFLAERKIFAEDLKELYRLYGIKRNAESDVKPMLESLYDRPAFAEVKERLAELEKHCALVIASNTDTEPLLQNFTYNKMAFQHIYTSEMLGCYKPDKKFYQSILTDLKLCAGETVFVGDSELEDILGPKSFGLKTVRVHRKNTEICSEADLILSTIPCWEDIKRLA